MEIRKYLLAVALFSISNLARAQDTGIRFEQGLSWQQILDKAKTEHKMIFVDCYATWCAPCKWMDENVYPLKNVGDIYNQQFICVRLQMDKTKEDNDAIKRQYVAASQLERSYAINAYPTFLFFDPDGKPLHKMSGSMDANAFIRLAKDAGNPQKQYYAILNNFQPGKLDTAGEKALANSFLNSDKQLAGAIMADYLSRIPSGQLSIAENQKIMDYYLFQPQIRQLAINYILSLSNADLLNDKNAFLLGDISNQSPVMQRIRGYVIHLDNPEVNKQENMKFIARFRRDPQVKQFALDYLNNLPEEDLYQKDKISFLASFTDTSASRGFMLFYRYSTKIDSLMGNTNYAQGIVESIISKENFKPLLDNAEKTDTAPDFDATEANISRKYNEVYARKVIINGKVSWYQFLVNKKQEDRYWPELINAKMAQFDAYRYDTLKTSIGADVLNNIAWSYIFGHSTDSNIITKAVSWMKNLVGLYPKQFNYLDTYACLLYKSGKKNEAIQCEGKALQIANARQSVHDIRYVTNSIERMKKDEQIWLEKDYQN